ncbi:MAG: alanine--tRNA ligase [Candidatus Izemoplasmatales bacterium]
MKQLTGSQVRKMWLDFFQSKGHSVEKGASLVPNDDPTLLWMNAGVAALKKYFDGSIVPKNPRIVNAQKCIRTNDIENVGKTARHHTFFEMLGNFSIGDYFRKEAVTWGFEILTDPKWFAFDKDRLYMTIYPDDVETKDLWISLGVDPSHIIPTDDDNFWEIGEGPCGPCTEIYFDRGPKFGSVGPNAIRDGIQNDRYIEIWNIVFSQYNAKAGLKRSEYPELPNKNIDTGCGLERITCVIQGVPTNFETDLFMPIMKKIEEIAGVPYEGQMAFKVIADHIRTVTFAVADGAVLANEGRGYVLRRLLRRAVKYGKKIGIQRPFMDELVDVVADIMKDYYPSLLDQTAIVKKVIGAEETKFLETLAAGEKRFEAIAASLPGKTIPGADAFVLYDTYGFPIELTAEYAEERGLSVDLAGFQAEMEKQKERARNARKDVQSMKSQNEAHLAFTAKSKFVGYDRTAAETRVLKVFPEGIVLEATPFYATSGGQVADTGVITNDKFFAQVDDVTKLPNGQFLHAVTILSGRVREGDVVLASVDIEKRGATAANHSATHLLFKALRDLLGTHVSQQGSQVSAEALRFDFNHFEPIVDETILELERRVVAMIGRDYPVETKQMTVDAAVARGAIAEFGEKYGDLVRVVDLKYTLDLCGGTHVKNLSDIRRFAIRGIQSIGSGIYRIEAVTNDGVQGIADTLYGIVAEIDNLNRKAYGILQAAIVDRIDLVFAAPQAAVPVGSYADVIAKRQEFADLQKAVKELEREYTSRRETATLKSLDGYFAQIRDGSFVGRVDGLDMNTLKQFVDNLAAQATGLVFVASVRDGKVAFVAKSKSLRFHAGQLVKTAAAICDGNGGGRPDFAQAGGKDVAKTDEAVAAVRRAIR